MNNTTFYNLLRTFNSWTSSPLLLVLLLINIYPFYAVIDMGYRGYVALEKTVKENNIDYSTVYYGLSNEGCDIQVNGNTFEVVVRDKSACLSKKFASDPEGIKAIIKQFHRETRPNAEKLAPYFGFLVAFMLFKALIVLELEPSYTIENGMQPFSRWVKQWCIITSILFVLLGSHYARSERISILDSSGRPYVTGTWVTSYYLSADHTKMVGLPAGALGKFNGAALGWIKIKDVGSN